MNSVTCVTLSMSMSVSNVAYILCTSPSYWLKRIEIMNSGVWRQQGRVCQSQRVSSGDGNAEGLHRVSCSSHLTTTVCNKPRVSILNYYSRLAWRVLFLCCYLWVRWFVRRPMRMVHYFLLTCTLFRQVWICVFLDFICMLRALCSIMLVWTVLWCNF